MVFTAQRYNTPSSLFGHTFLKIDSKDYSSAINFSAMDIPDNENGFLYAYRGIFGGYSGKYTQLSYNSKQYEYNNFEFRDLQEYKLNLTQEQIRNILLHFYEIKNTHNDYYFITQNCSTEIFKLLSLADEEINEKLKNSSILLPFDVLTNLHDNNLIKNYTVSFSKLSRFYKLESSLNTTQREILNDLLQEHITASELDDSNKLSKKEKTTVIKTAILYYEIKSIEFIQEKKSLSILMKLLNLAEKYELFKEESKADIKKVDDMSRTKSKLKVGYETDQTLMLGYRYLYKSRLDMMDEVSGNGSVELLDFGIKNKNGKMKLDYFTLLNVESFPASDIYFKNKTTSITIGSKELYNDEKKRFFARYGVGMSTKIGNSTSLLFEIAPMLTYFSDVDMSVGAKLLSTTLFSNKIIVENKLQHIKYSDGVSQNIYEISLHGKVGKNSKLEIKSSVQDDISTKSKFMLFYHLAL